MGIRFGKFRLSCRFDASKDYLEIGPQAGAYFPQRITAIDDGWPCHDVVLPQNVTDVDFHHLPIRRGVNQFVHSDDAELLDERAASYPICQAPQPAYHKHGPEDRLRAPYWVHYPG